MSRLAAERGFERFLERTVDEIRREFSVARAVRGTGLGAGGFVVDRLRENADTLERLVLEPELAGYRERSLAQFRLVLEYAEGSESIDAYADEPLARDSYVEALADDASPADRRAVEERVLERLRRLGDGVEPIVRRPEDAFWPAATAALDRTSALELVEGTFPFTGPLQDHPELFVFQIRLDPSDVLRGPFVPDLPAVRLEYTDEAVRAMITAERRVVRDLTATVRDRFLHPSG